MMRGTVARPTGWRAREIAWGRGEPRSLLDGTTMGTEKRFVDFLAASKELMFAIIFKRQIPRHDTDECFQDASLKLWNNFSTIESHPKQNAYVASTVSSVCNDYWRRRMRYKEVLAAYADALETSQSAVKEIDFDLLQRVIAQLKNEQPYHAAAVQLRCFEGLSNQQIAELFGVPQTTVTNWISRGKARLQTLLADGDKK